MHIPVEEAMADKLRLFSATNLEKFFARIFRAGQTGAAFNVYLLGGSIHLPMTSVQYHSTVLFGRDVFGKVSQCYKIENNVLTLRRTPDEIDDAWHSVPQGTIIVFRGKTHDAHLITQTSPTTYTFHDRNSFSCHIYFFADSIAVTNLVHHLSTFGSEKVQLHRMYGNNLLNVSQSVLNTDEALQRKPLEIQNFIGIFTTIMPLRYQEASTKEKLFLFSGGVDSLFVVVIAALTFPVEDELVLLSVAFQEEGKDFETVHDRKAGVKAYEWLQERFPNRKFSFVRINVRKDELERERKRVIAWVAFPNHTVLDDSIASTLYFGTRARGFVTENGVDRNVSYPKSKWVLVGSGSDELLGGYHRVRRLYDSDGYPKVVEDLQSSIRDIGNRNFGRDDRVAASNCRLLRVPFMDEEIVAHINDIPLNYKVDFEKELGHGEKLILRYALSSLGAPEVLTAQPKKAMQFGSNLASLDGKQRGHEKSKQLDVTVADRDAAQKEFAELHVAA